MAKNKDNDPKRHATDDEIDHALDPYTKGAGTKDSQEGKKMDDEIMRKLFGDKAEDDEA